MDSVRERWVAVGANAGNHALELDSFALGRWPSRRNSVKEWWITWTVSFSRISSKGPQAVRTINFASWSFLRPARSGVERASAASSVTRSGRVECVIQDRSHDWKGRPALDRVAYSCRRFTYMSSRDSGNRGRCRSTGVVDGCMSWSSMSRE